MSIVQTYIIENGIFAKDTIIIHAGPFGRAKFHDKVWTFIPADNTILDDETWTFTVETEEEAVLLCAFGF